MLTWVHVLPEINKIPAYRICTLDKFCFKNKYISMISYTELNKYYINKSPKWGCQNKMKFVQSITKLTKQLLSLLT